LGHRVKARAVVTATVVYGMVKLPPAHLSDRVGDPPEQWLVGLRGRRGKQPAEVDR
jgi:hypothetical protein